MVVFSLQCEFSSSQGTIYPYSSVEQSSPYIWCQATHTACLPRRALGQWNVEWHTSRVFSRMSSRISLDVDWTTPIEEKYAQVKLHHESPGFLVIILKKICVQPPTCFFLSQLWSGHFRFSLIQGQVLSSKILGRIFVPKNPTKPGVCKKQCCSRYSVSKKTMPTFKFCWNFLLENIQFQTSRFRAMKKKQPELRKPQTAATTTASREKIAEKMERQIYDRLPEKPSDPNQQFFLVDFWVRGRHSWLRKATKMRLRRGL